MGRKRKPPRSRPSFFKVLVGDFSEQLRIPPAFIKHFNGNLPGKSIIKSPTGRCWRVNVGKSENDLFFQNGWQKFVKDHSLEFGDFLIFKYIGISKFTVKIYGRSACEKELAMSKRNNDDPIYQTQKVRQGEAIAEFSKNKSKYHEGNCKKKAFDSSKMDGGYAKPKRNSDDCNPHTQKVKMGDYVKPKSKHFIENMGKSSLATTCSFKTVHPHKGGMVLGESAVEGFITTIKACNCVCGKPYMNIPREFAISTGLTWKNNIALRNPFGKLWLVKLQSRMSSIRVNFAQGWHEFLVGNNLKEGDTCIFELHSTSRTRGLILDVRILPGST
ncbi:hypothetical protein HHK36_003125 [Tetracentron sinense]|uniref:TF-B3 domain-containing protein n=1 Tax=Tetracentron sinense TaxID=13715 RepID=A0A835DND3_TETSI|nr:hypothetical protein HHK36_003125 [Tetracentron sinense]